MTRNFPTISEMLAIHDDQIALFGGALAIRDMGALESAVMRPQLGYYNGIIEEAADLLESLVMSHPFVDGTSELHRAQLLKHSCRRTEATLNATAVRATISHAPVRDQLFPIPLTAFLA